MNYKDVLNTEYKEQYNQYRWIGQIQAIVLTFYGVVTTFAIATMVVLSSQSQNKIDYNWPAGIMIGIGFLGLLLGYGLFRSRTMQRRTYLYLNLLLMQMADNVEDAEPIKNSALRFRSLCSTQGRFKLSDTINIAILIAFYSGEVLLFVGILTILVFGSVLCLSQAIIIGLMCMVLFVVLTPILIQCLMMNKEEKLSIKEYEDAAKIQTVKQMRECLGITKLVEPN